MRCSRRAGDGGLSPLSWRPTASPATAAEPDPGWWRLPALSGVLLGLSYFPAPFLVLNFTAFLPVMAWLASRPAASAYRTLQAGIVCGLAAELVMLDRGGRGTPLKELERVADRFFREEEQESTNE